MTRLDHCFRALFVGLTAAGAVSASGQPVQFQRSIGMTTSETAYEIAPTSDRGFITVGRRGATATTPGDIYVVRYDENGNDLWTRVIGSTTQRNDVGYTIRQTTDGGFIIGAETDSVSNQLGIGLVKLNAVGALMWSRVYLGTPFLDSPAGVELNELSDGSIVVVGRHSFGGAGAPIDAVLLRVSAAGIPMFLNRYAEVGAAADGASLSFADFVTLSDGFIIAGWMTDAAGGQRQSFLMKTTLAGAPVWARTYTVAGTDTTADSILLAPGNVAFCGRYGAAAAFAARVDLAGGLAWNRIIGGFRPGFAAAVNDSDDLAVFAGTALNPTNGALLRFDPLGTFVDGMRYGDDRPTQEHDVQVLPCNFGYALTGQTTMVPGNGQEDVHLIRTDASGRSACREKVFTPGVTFTAPAVIIRNISMTPDVQHVTWGITITDPFSGNFRYCFKTGCPADINGDGFIDFSDYLEFLTIYDAESPCADFNGDGLVDFNDYLEFLTHYDAGC